MFKTLKILMLKLIKLYHHHMIAYYDDRSSMCNNRGYSGMYYSDKAWWHVYKEIELNNKLMEQRGT